MKTYGSWLGPLTWPVGRICLGSMNLKSRIHKPRKEPVHERSRAGSDHQHPYQLHRKLFQRKKLKLNVMLIYKRKYRSKYTVGFHMAQIF